MIDGFDFLKKHGIKVDEALAAPPACRRTSDASSKAYAFALRSLGAAGASEARLKCRMERRGFQNGEIESALERLKAIGFLNDALLAKGIIDKSVKSFEGESLIRMKLQKAGIGGEEIERSMAAAREDMELCRGKFSAFLEAEFLKTKNPSILFKLCKKKGQPYGLAKKAIEASCTPGSVAL